MNNLKECLQILQNKFPNKIPTQAIDYDSNWFLVMAVDDPTSIDYDSPWYAINKSNGAIRNYSPIDDIENFTKAIRNRVINFEVI